SDSRRRRSSRLPCGRLCARRVRAHASSDRDTASFPIASFRPSSSGSGKTMNITENGDGETEATRRQGDRATERQRDRGTGRGGEGRRRKQRTRATGHGLNRTNKKRGKALSPRPSCPLALPSSLSSVARRPGGPVPWPPIG